MNVTRNWAYTLKGKRYVGARQPALHDGRAFGVFHYQKGSFYESVLYCINAASGIERWQFTVPHILNAPVVDTEGYVYLSSFDGQVHCLDGASGQIRWQTPKTRTNVNVPVLDHHGRVVVPDLSSQTAQVRCFDTSSGQLRWQIPTGGHTYVAAISEGRVIYSTARRKEGVILSCVSLDNGHVLWQIPSEHYMFHPVVQTGVIYIGSHGELRAYDLQNGTLLTTLSLQKDFAVNAKLLLYDDMLYFGDGEGQCYAVEITTDRNVPTQSVQYNLRWQSQTTDEVAAQPVYIQDVVAFLSKDGSVHLLEAQSGALVKQVKLKTKNDFGGMHYDNRRLYVAHGRELICYDVQD